MFWGTILCFQGSWRPRRGKCGGCTADVYCSWHRKRQFHFRKECAQSKVCSHKILSTSNVSDIRWKVLHLYFHYLKMHTFKGYSFMKKFYSKMSLENSALSSMIYFLICIRCSFFFGGFLLFFLSISITYPSRKKILDRSYKPQRAFRNVPYFLVIHAPFPVCSFLPWMFILC